MQEVLLHFIWGNNLIRKKTFKADTGEKITIIEPGIQNFDGGPDFTNARIRIDDTTWAGNVEIHVDTCDWYHHKHHTDSAYDNVILHVAAKGDRPCFNSAGRQVPCILIMTPKKIEGRYTELLGSHDTIPCSMQLVKIDRSRKLFWMQALTVKRLENKSRSIRELLEYTRNSWEDAFFIHLARNFGLKINTVPFELLAKSIPLKYLNSKPGDLFRTEAILFGQAGFLKGKSQDDYHSGLKKEYDYLTKKYGLKPIDAHVWKFLRLRPSNFPTIRIAQLSYLISANTNLFSRTIDAGNMEQLYKLYSCEVSDYWKTHYNFRKITPVKEKNLGKYSINNLIINTIIPFLFVYGNLKNNQHIKDFAFSLLEGLPAENNKVTRQWKEAGFRISNAADSQALIELSEQYCSRKHCLDCQLGHMILSMEYTGAGNG